MKRPLAYITAAWLGGDSENAELAAQYCHTVYEAGFSPICPPLYLPLFLNDAVPEEHKSGIDMSRDLLRRSHVLVVCGHSIPAPASWSRTFARALAQPRLQLSTQNAALYALKRPRPFMPLQVSVSVRPAMKLSKLGINKIHVL